MAHLARTLHCCASHAGCGLLSHSPLAIPSPQSFNSIVHCARGSGLDGFSNILDDLFNNVLAPSVLKDPRSLPGRKIALLTNVQVICRKWLFRVQPDLLGSSSST